MTSIFPLHTALLHLLFFSFSELHSRFYFHIKWLGYYFPLGTLNAEMIHERTMWEIRYCRHENVLTANTVCGNLDMEKD